LGLLDRIAKGKHEPHLVQRDGPKPSKSPRRNEISKWRSTPDGPEAGIPPLKEPALPPGRAATLIACTKTRRAYWIVFKRSLASQAGWTWERNIQAVPLPAAHTSSRQISLPMEITPAGEDLHMGGQDWGEWSCPGCGQQQIPRAGYYIHCTPCSCGTYCCLGPGRPEDGIAKCPNCGRTIQQTGRTQRSIDDAHHSTAVQREKGAIFPVRRSQLE